MLQVITPNVAESAHFYRQILASIGVSLLALTGGLAVGFSAVLLPQLKTDSSFPYDESFDSWIASIIPLAMVIGSLFSGLLSDAIGRRTSLLVLTLPYTLGWVIMGAVNNNAVMLIGRFVTGACRGAMRANIMVYIGESTDPKYRAVAFFCLTLTNNLGILISHTVGKYFHWKTSCFIFTLPNVIAFVILMFLNESPLWLISKGKIDDGIESFRQFRGTGNSAERELLSVLERTKEKAEENATFKDILNILFSKPFMKSLVTIFLLFLTVQWCGINTLAFYAQMIFEKTFSGDIDAFLLMIVTDCIKIATAAILCIFGKVVPRKITFVVLSESVSLVLIGLVIYLYLTPVGLVWVAVTCMVIYIAMASALSSISWSIVPEIFPSKLRGFGSGLSVSISFILLFISVKITPEIMNRFGEKIMYASFAGGTLFTGIFLFFILPETNGRSLQDIEDSLYNKKCDEKKDIGMVKSTTVQVSCRM